MLFECVKYEKFNVIDELVLNFSYFMIIFAGNH